MKLKTLVAATLLGVSSVAAGPVFAGAVTIDLFDDPWSPAQSVTDTSADGIAVTSSYTTTLPNQILGDVRDISINMLSSQFGQSAELNVLGGYLNWDNGSGVKSQAIVQWDATPGPTLNPTGLGGYDLLAACGGLGCTTLNAIVMAADLGFNYQIAIYTDASNYTILSSGSVGGVPDDFPAPYESSYDLAWFSLPTGDYLIGGLPFHIDQFGGGVDLTNVGAIQLTMENSGTCYKKDGSGMESCRAAVDVTLDNIRAVAEPASLALTGLGLVGLAALRRRKQS